MDEHKDDDVSCSTVVEFPEQTVSDHVGSGDSEKTKVVEPVASEVKVRSPGVTKRSSSEGVVAEGGGSCNGEEVKVGVISSDILVDGVCMHDTGDGGGSILSQEATGSQGGLSGMGSDVEDLVGGGESGNSYSRASVDSGVGALNLVAEHNPGRPPELAESEEGKLEVGGAKVREVSNVGRNNTADDSTLQGVRGGSIPDVRVGSTFEGTATGEVQVMDEKVAEVTGEESSDGGLGKEDVNTLDIRPSEIETQDQRIDNYVGDTTAVVGTSAVERQVFIAEEKFESAEAAVDQAKETNGSVGDALQDVEMQNIGALQDEVWKPGIETADASSSAVVEDSSADTPVVEETSVGVASTKNSNPKVEVTIEEIHDSDAVKVVIPSSETDSFSTENDAFRPIPNTTSNLNGQTQVAVDGKVASMDNEDIGSPNIEGMDTDAFNENFYFSVEELQATFETANGSTENCYHAFADLQSSQQLTPVVVGGETLATEDKMLLNSEKDENLITAECSDQRVSHTSCQVHYLGPERAEQATHAEHASIQKEQGKLETANDSTINHSNMCLDLTASCQPAQAVVGDEIAEMDDKVLSEPNSKGSVIRQPDGKLSSLGDSQHLKTESDYEEKNNQTISMYKDKELNSAAEVSEPAEKVQEWNPATTVCGNTETDSRVVDGGKTSAVNNDMTLKPNTELAVPAEGDQYLKVEEGLDENASNCMFDFESDMGKETAVQEHVADAQQIGLHEGQEMEAEEQYSDSESVQPKITDDISAKQAALNPGNTLKAHQARYELRLDDEHEFDVSDLVWGKVRSHPWWPGQIFNPSDASEKAMKYHKKDCFLVAYFGDRSFAWNEASLLKPFKSNFSHVEKQSNSEIFQNAVNCALEEVSRRVEFGLACSCLLKDTYDSIKFQIVENAGIQQESSVTCTVDNSLHFDLLEPHKLVEYMKALAQSPAGGADRLELVIAKSQLLSFYRLKGYSQLPEFQFCGGLENADTLHFEDEGIEDSSPVSKDDGQSSSGQEISQTQRSSYHKRKHNLKDTIYPWKKERSLSELMDDSWDSVDDEIDPDGKANNKLVSPSSSKKRRGSDSVPDDSATAEGRKTISLAKVSTRGTLPKPSFKIGECIRRVASQMTGTPSILKSNSQKPDGGSDGLVGDGSDVLVQQSEDPEMRKMNVPTEYSSLDELLSQLHLAARDPLRGYSFLTIIISFFSDFRNTVIMEKHDKVGGKRRQASHSIGGSPETFEFEDMNDTYWTDRVIQNGSEEQPPRKSRKRDTQLVSVDRDKPLNNKSYSRKRYSDGNDGVLAEEKPVGYVDENAPAELVMHFPVVDSVPSETSLNKMFRRFGPLKEYETETDKYTNRARVVFKKCSDAEAAYGSAPKFNIFGSTLVNYQLNYTVSVPFKTQPVVTLPCDEDETLFLQF